MKKITKKFAVLALSTALMATAGAAVGAYSYTYDAITASAAFIDGMTKVDTAAAPASAMPLEEGKVKNAADWGYYDNNGDGYVDIIDVIYAGYGEASNSAKLENTVWPHQWQLEQPMVVDGVQISKYACNNELDGYQGNDIDGIGTFCHEFSHCLGLPDFYSTGTEDTFGMASWSLMH